MEVVSLAGALSEIVSSRHHLIIIHDHLVYLNHHTGPEYEVPTHLAGSQSLHVGFIVLHLELSVGALQRVRRDGAQLGQTETLGFPLLHRRPADLLLLLHLLPLLLVPGLSVGVGTTGQADVVLRHAGGGGGDV